MAEERRGDISEQSVRAAFFKQIRFGEIGLSLQDCDDLHLSITGRAKDAEAEYTMYSNAQHL